MTNKSVNGQYKLCKETAGMQNQIMILKEKEKKKKEREKKKKNAF